MGGARRGVRGDGSWRDHDAARRAVALRAAPPRATGERAAAAPVINRGRDKRVAHAQPRRRRRSIEHRSATPPLIRARILVFRRSADTRAMRRFLIMAVKKNDRRGKSVLIIDFWYTKPDGTKARYRRDATVQTKAAAQTEATARELGATLFG